MVWRPEFIRTQRTQNKFVIVRHYDIVCLLVYLGARISAVQIPSHPFRLPFCMANSLGDVILHYFSGPYLLSLPLYIWRPECVRTQRTQSKFVTVRDYVCLSVYLGARIQVSCHSIPLQSPQFLHGFFPLAISSFTVSRACISSLSLSVHMAAASSTEGSPISQQRSSMRNALSSMTTPYRT